MTTDFNYSNTTTTSTGPFKPKNRNVPLNARYRVEKYADIATIPVPAVGELIFVLSDENNDNQQNIYVIKSLKPSNLGVADSLVDEVVPLKTFLGTNDINLSDYPTKMELDDIINNISVSDMVVRNIYENETFSLLPSSSIIEVTDISISPQSYTCNVGEQFTIQVTIEPYNANNKSYTINIADKSILSIEGNTITALKAGETDIIATSNNNLTAFCKVIVNSSDVNIPVESVSLQTNEISINVNSETSINAIISPSNATNKNVTWASNNDNVTLTPNELNCKIIGNKIGSSLLTVTTEDGSHTDTCNITITETVITDENNPILYWKASNSNMSDLSMNGNDGDISNVTFSDNNAILPDTTSSVSLNTINNFSNKKTNGAFEIYFKPYDLLKSDNKNYSFFNHLKRASYTDDNIVQFTFKYYASDGTSLYTKSVDMSLNNEEFNHLVITWDFSDTSNLYIKILNNGVVTSSTLTNFTSVDDNFFSSISLKGVQDLKMFKLFNNTLSEEKMMELYNSKDS